MTTSSFFIPSSCFLLPAYLQPMLFPFRNFLILLLSCCQFNSYAQKSTKDTAKGNPVFEGWYADPEVVLFDKKAWIYPTYSAPYEKQVFMDAFSSKDLKTWKKHSKIIDTSAIKW